MKIVLASAAFALALSGAAFAQSGSSGSGGNSSATSTTPMQATEEGGMQFKSDDEKAMYSNSARMAPFFTDNSMKTMKSDSEVKAAFSAMGANDQAEMKTACERAMENRGSYGSVTTSLCTAVMAN